MSRSQQTLGRDDPWSLSEQVAFECALARDERESWRALRERDQSLELPGELWSPRENRRGIARAWLRERLRRDPVVKLAADSVMQSLGVAGQLLAALGGLMGVAAATAALAYTGQAPINVSAFFFVFVLLQALLAVALLLAFLMPAGLKELLVAGPIFRVSRFVLRLLLEKTQALAGRFLAGQNRHDAAEIAGLARSRLALHGRQLKWLSFRKIQGAALCFNLGALAALLVSVFFSDRAFGWQTTLELRAEQAQRVTELVASPWSWRLGEGVGYPTVEQIEGSRIVLKDGIQSLETDDLTIWWKFLALGMLCYGILPRAVFWGLGGLQFKKAVRDYDFRNAAAERLFERLRPRRARFEAERVAQGADLGPVGEAAHDTSSSRSAVCLFSRELEAIVDVAALRRALAERWSMSLESVQMRPLSDGSIDLDGESLSEERQYALVFESWMPPIKEIERRIKEMRAAVDARSLIKVVLLGIPQGDKGEVSLAPAGQYADVWDSFIRRLGDPYLILDNPS
ncbi:DUF2868 domain-containing protein [Pelagicoccus sp. SDUM812003]|uniref:DUF2868 domain-containing protein n=1 Tax=Pelagicoccus sp. SDUM812003 TaxID=3041267 RepID=UPI00280D6492|nr:DUF2868 domain-containing protein [Pelagicoccus sp. SDUM812003]MDQ8202355.1 DUF2868 domain-containing protein [Pelagicoccus sp. SDUM812003]